MRNGYTLKTLHKFTCVQKANWLVYFFTIVYFSVLSLGRVLSPRLTLYIQNIILTCGARQISSAQQPCAVNGYHKQ